MKQWLKKSKFSRFLGIALICFTSPCASQINLLPDGSFEDTMLNWNTQFYGGSMGLNKWLFFLGVAPNTSYGVSVPFSSIVSQPYNLPGGYFAVLPHSGVMAIEIATHCDLDKYKTPNKPWSILNMRTPIRSKLSQKLVAGKTYCGTVYVSNQHRQTYYNTNGMGMYFDNGKLDTVITKVGDTSGMYGRYCQAQVISYDVIHDSINWKKIQGSFVANGTEEYVTIGNWLTDSTQTKVINGPLAWMCTGCYFSDVIIDDASVIPIDISNWLHDTFSAFGDSVWVGLGKFDFTEGIWYNSAMQQVATGQGFWFTPTQPQATFIHKIDVCGAAVYDTMNVYGYPLAINNVSAQSKELSVYPNPNNGSFTITVSPELIGKPLIIVDALGTEIVHQSALVQNKINLQNFSAGVYLVRVHGAYQWLIKE
jgi:Secretion system C-terminal sorting domain